MYHTDKCKMEYDWSLKLDFIVYMYFFITNGQFLRVFIRFMYFYYELFLLCHWVYFFWGDFFPLLTC